MDLVEGLPPRGEAGGRGVGGTAGVRDGPSWGVESSVEDGGAGVLRRVNAVEEMIEDMIEDMNTQVRHPIVTGVAGRWTSTWEVDL